MVYGCLRPKLSWDQLLRFLVLAKELLDDASWDRTKIPAERVGKEFLQVCGNLVVFDEDDQTARLAHHTVGQFLNEIKIPRVDSDIQVGDICLTYLKFSDFERQLVTAGKGYEIFKAGDVSQSAFARIPHILGIRKRVYDFLLAIYSQKNKMSLPDADYAELLRKYERKPLTTSLEQQYRLLNYVTENWVWHTQHFEQHIHGCWRKFHDLALIKTLHFDFRPWTTVWPQRTSTPQHFSVEPRERLPKPASITPRNFWSDLRKLAWIIGLG